MGPKAGLGSTGGSSSDPSSAAKRKSDATAAAAADDDDTPLSAIGKKASKAAGASSSGSGGNNFGPKKTASKNGVRGGESKTFTIPKREGLSPRPASSQGAVATGTKAARAGSSSALSSSSSPRPVGAGGKKAGSGSMRREVKDEDDDAFEPKPVKLKKRPEDFTRREDPAKLARKRKLLEEQERAKQEARKKKRPDSQASSSKAKVKVKPDPDRRGSSSATARSAGGGGGGGGKPKPSRVKKEQAVKKFKAVSRADKIEQAMKVYKWWEEPAHEQGKHWRSLEHNGAHFAPEYKPHGVKLKYDGKDVHLTPQQEEVATFYASMPLDGPQLAEQGTVFNKNFFADFKSVLGKGHKIKDFKLLDFSAMRAHLDIAKQIKRAATDGEKAAAKTVKEELTVSAGARE
ncbi:unnamed protein product [Hapterophycus canaliculatus]